MQSIDVRPVMPWWRVPTVWLVVGGPATVVVAGVVTAVIAIRGADPEVARSAVPRAITELRIDLPQLGGTQPAATTDRPAPTPAQGARP